jgi:hypothetical protein
MRPSILSQVIDSIMSGFSNTIAEDVIGATLLAAAIVKPWVVGEKAPRWAALVDGTSVVCLMLGYFVIRATVAVWRDIANRPAVREVESLLYTADERKSRQWVRDQWPPYFQLKLIAIGFCFICILAGALCGIRTMAKSHRESIDATTVQPRTESIPALAFHIGTISQADGNLQVNVSCVNASPSVVIRTSDCSAMLVVHNGALESVTPDVQDAYFERFVREHRTKLTKTCTGSINIGMTCWFSLSGPPIRAIGSDLILGKKSVVIVGRAVFTGDGAQTYKTETCAFARPVKGAPTPWNKCQVHNYDDVVLNQN